MERITYRITLDTHKNGIQRTLQGFETADNMSRRIVISLSAGGGNVELPNDIVAAVYVTTPNASEPSINTCTIQNDLIIYDVLPIAEEGITEMQVKVIEVDPKGAKSVLMAPRFAVEVTESNADDGSAEQTSTFTALEDAIAKAHGAYNARLLRVDIGKDCVFRAYYADGSIYENYYLYEALRSGNALMSESWAVGGTGAREGEDTNNSRYFSNVSKSASEEADIVSEEARGMLEETRLYSTFTAFNVDFNTGNLDYLSANYNFGVNEESGQLEAMNNGSYDPEQIIGSVVDEYIEKQSAELTGKVDEALNIAKGKNQAHVFATTEDMNAWLSDVANKGLYNVGDNLYIESVEVPDWWISEVLDAEDSTTGFYYKISQLETQKVDLTEVNANISENEKEIDEANERISKNAQDISNMKSSILDTMEEVNANTQENQLAGANAVKELGEKTLPLTGTAEKAKALTTNAGGHNQPVYFKNGVPVALNTLLEADVLSKRPTVNFGTQFRTDLGFDALSDYAISIIRTDESGNPHLPQYSSGLAWVHGDTQGFLIPNWNSRTLLVGGGSGQNINWVKEVAWDEDMRMLYTFANHNGYINDALRVDFANAYGEYNKSYIVAKDQAIDCPNDFFFGIREVLWYAQNHVVVRLTGLAADGVTSRVWTNTFWGDVWRGWDAGVVADDLANYLPKSGDHAVDGNFSFVTSDEDGERKVAVSTGQINAFLLASANVAGLYNTAHGWLLQVDTNGNVDLHSKTTKGGSKVITAADFSVVNNIVTLNLS